MVIKNNIKSTIELSTETLEEIRRLHTLAIIYRSNDDLKLIKKQISLGEDAIASLTKATNLSKKMHKIDSNIIRQSLALTIENKRDILKLLNSDVKNLKNSYRSILDYVCNLKKDKTIIKVLEEAESSNTSKKIDYFLNLVLWKMHKDLGTVKETVIYIRKHKELLKEIISPTISEDAIYKRFKTLKKYQS